MGKGELVDREIKGLRGLIVTEKFEVTINGETTSVSNQKSVMQLLNTMNIEVPSLCYHPSLGAIETCDTCIVKVNGEYVRSCSTTIQPNDNVETVGEDIHEAQMIAMDRILGNHELYCTVCDFNNGNCEIHNTVKEMKISSRDRSYIKRCRSTKK